MSSWYTPLQYNRRKILRGGGKVLCTISQFSLAGALMEYGMGCAGLPPGGGSEELDSSPPLSGLTDFAGNPKPLPEMAGRVALLDFWASWCGPCRQGFRYLDQLFQTYAGDGLLVIGISVDSDSDDARRFYGRLRPHFPVAWDKSGKVRERFRVRGLPTSILLNREGRLVHRHEGFDPSSHRLLESHVRRMVRGI